jgi:chromosome segregation ATPase
MRKSLAIFALALLTALSLPCALTAQSYRDNLTLLESKLLDSKLQLANLDEQIANLKQTLQEAVSNSESSALTIASLRLSLSEAQAAQEQQASQAQQLQATLTTLSESLDASKKQAQANEIRAAAAVEKMAQDYEWKLHLRTTVIWIVVGIVAAETGVLVWQMLK